MENPIFKGGFYSKGERFCISQKRFCEMMKGETYFTWVCKGLGPSVDELLELSEADMVVFLGVVNFLLDDISYDEAQDLLSQISFDWLKEKNQLHLEMKAGSVFYVSAYLQV